MFRFSDSKCRLFLAVLLLISILETLQGSSPLPPPATPFIEKHSGAWMTTPPFRSLPTTKLTLTTLTPTAKTLHLTKSSIPKPPLSSLLKCPLRDLRVLDHAYKSGTVILPRPGGIICSILNLKTIVLPRAKGTGGKVTDEGWVFTEEKEEGIDHFLKGLEQHLEARYIGNTTASSHSPKFHLVFLESLLKHTLSTLSTNVTALQISCTTLLPSSTQSKNVGALSDLLPLKNQLTEMYAVVRDIFNCLSDLLSDDEDLDLLSANGGEGGSHMDVEMMLEDYLQQLEELLIRVRSSQTLLTNTEAILELSLDLTRNKILRFELLLSISSLAISLGALVTGLFGMNLLSHVENNPNLFWAVTVAIGGVMWAVFTALLSKLRKDINLEIK